MMIKIAIADKNREYVEKMVNVLEGYEGITLFAYTDRQALEQALLTRHFDVLLFDPSVYQGQAKTDRSMLAVMLLDKNAGVPESCKNFKKIQKYQRISRIYQQMLELYAEVCEDTGEIVGGSRTAAVAFYSPIGGVGKTTLALAVATRLAAQGYRTFYLNLEDMASEDCYLEQSGGKGMSELVSCLGEEINFGMKIKGLLLNKTDRLFYLNHFESPNDILEMTGEETLQLIEQFQRADLFDVLVIDLGVAFNEKVQNVFEAADKIVLVEKTDAIAERKMSCFLDQIHIIKEYGKKMVRVMNFDVGRESAVSSDIPLAGRIHRVPNPDAAQLITALAGDESSNFTAELLS